MNYNIKKLDINSLKAQYKRIILISYYNNIIYIIIYIIIYKFVADNNV